MNLVNLPQSLLVSCLLELKLDEALVQVILTSDNVLSVQSTILLGEYSYCIIKIEYIEIMKLIFIIIFRRVSSFG